MMAADDDDPPVATEPVPGTGGSLVDSEGVDGV